MNVTSRHHSHFRLDQTFLLKQSWETGSTGFLLSGLAPIALKVFFCYGGRLDKKVGIDKGCSWKL